MELKLNTHRSKSLDVKSFNRTFMELKCTYLGSIDSAIQFQSYLYGIEINFKSCLNLINDMFQSYLYGIEMPEFADLGQQPT